MPTPTAAVSLTHGLVKLRPDASVPASATIISIAAGRNEYTSFQVAVSAPEGGGGATVAGIDVAFPGTLEPSALLVHRAHYINISIVSNCAGALGRWPDALIPEKDVYDKQTRNAFPAPVAAGTNQAFWVDVFVRNGTAPGVHTGSVTVRWGSGTSGSSSGEGGSEDGSQGGIDGDGVPAPAPAPTVLPLTLKVHKFTLPSISRYSTTYNCNSKAIVAGRMEKTIPTRAQRVEWQKQYVDLGLMHRVTFSDFLKADKVALGLPVPPGNATAVDWGATEKAWGKYLGSEGAGLVQTPFGLGETRPTSINLPAMHYPGPFVNGTPPNHTLIDELWRATGCTKPTPDWGYAYWSSLYDYGVHDMLTYCDHCAEGLWDPWAKGCCDKGAKTVCHKQPPPKVKRGPVNNSLAIGYWKDVAAHAKKAGWWQRVFDYTCDEPGADPARYPACLAHAQTVHSADRDYQVLITAEKKSADAVNIR